MDANPAKRKTKRGINAFIVRWLAKEQDKGGAAVDRAMGPISKGAAKMQHGVQRHGDDLTAFQMAAVERMLAENKEDKT